MLARLCDLPRPGRLLLCLILALGLAGLLAAWAPRAEAAGSVGSAGGGSAQPDALSGGSSIQTVQAGLRGSPDLMAALALQQAELTASDGATNDQFGTSVAISGDTALVAAPFHDTAGKTDAGAVYVFTRSGSTWTQQAELTASDGATYDYFGISVALDGNTALVGAYQHKVGSNVVKGAVYVFTGSGSNWMQQMELTASDGAGGDAFGCAVALDGTTALVGAYGHQVGSARQGAAYVFTGSGSTWTQQAELTASDGADNGHFGQSVALDDGAALIGALGYQTGQGAAYIFTGSGSSWTQQAKLTASDGAAYDYFGSSVIITGDTALVADAQGHVDGNVDQGAVYVFSRSGSSWSQQAKLTASDGAAWSQFGYSIALDGDTLLVGANGQTLGGNTFQGAVYVFNHSGSSWTQQAQFTASDGAASDFFGSSIALDGSTILVGAIGRNAFQGVACVESLAPANSAAPVVSGTTNVGDSISCASGSWIGVPTPTFTYQWLRDGAAITDATSTSYIVTAADRGHELSCRVTATNDRGSASATSNSLSVPAPSSAPAGTAAPVVSGTAVLGDTLACSQGTWTGNPTPSCAYQWLRDGAAIAGAASPTYAVQIADCRHVLSCRVTASNSAGQAGATSNTLTVKAAPALTLKLSPRTVALHKKVTIRGTVTNSLSSARKVCIYRKSGRKVALLKRATISSTGAFRWKMKTTRAGKMVLLVRYQAAGLTFQSKTATLKVRK